MRAGANTFWVHEPIKDAGGRARAQNVKLAVKTRTDHLAGVPLFAGLNKRQLRAVAEACGSVRFSDGAGVVTEGDSSDALFIIVEGSVEVQRKGRRVARIGAGEFFGEIALLDPGPRTATVTAASDVIALKLTRKNLLDVLRSDPQIPVRMMEALARRLRATTEKISN
jgi:CRP/FNR family transcriptional regulator